MIQVHYMKNMLGKKKILQIHHNPALSESLTRQYYWVKSNVLLVLNAVQLMSYSGIINNKTQVQIIHVNLYLNCSRCDLM